MRPFIQVITARYAERHALPQSAIVYIGRPSPLGNPVVLPKGASPAEREAAVRSYLPWLREQVARGNQEVIKALRDLARHARTQPLYLRCHCAPKRCHGDVLRALLLRALALRGPAPDVVLLDDFNPTTET